MTRVVDSLVKYECFNCGEQFIASEYAIRNKNYKVSCPYCNSHDIEAIVLMDDQEKLSQLGCLGLYHD